jgi:hypothetical protein
MTDGGSPAPMPPAVRTHTAEEVAADTSPAKGGPVVAEVGRIVAAGAVRLVWWWPGVVATLAAYAAVALALYRDSYPNLWGGLAAGVVATAWYASPLRRLESRRRDRLRA